MNLQGFGLRRNSVPPSDSESDSHGGERASVGVSRVQRRKKTPIPHNDTSDESSDDEEQIPKPEKDILTDCFLCKKLNFFADELYYIWDIVKRLKCQDGKAEC